MIEMKQEFFIFLLLPCICFGRCVKRVGGIIYDVTCEGHAANLSCDSGKTIHIVKASYGRHDDYTCNSTQINTTDCHSSQSLSTVIAYCNGQNECNIDASNQVFGDPCVGTYKYLSIEYKCRKQIAGQWKKVMACEHDEVTLQCPLDKLISVIKASYGRQEGNSTCPHEEILTTDCHASTSLERVKDLCNGQRMCTVQAENSVFGDPCYLTFKYLTVMYECKQEPKKPWKEEVACENSQVNIECQPYEVINIEDASFGRHDDSTCPHSSIQTNDCHSEQSLTKVKEKCEGKNKCQVQAKVSVFGDPCSGTYKYLLVKYQCKKVPWIEEVACENTEINIECPPNEVIKINDASFGRNDYSTCPHISIKTTDCHEEQSLSIVKGECEDKNMCQVEAKVSVFGDPCSGTNKYLSVKYHCKKEKKTEMETVACENQKVAIECPEKKVINILAASYGRHDVLTCPHMSIRTTHCDSDESMSKVLELCEDQNSCEVMASSSTFGGDPCAGTYKYLSIKYECIADYIKEVMECEHETISIKCHADRTIEVLEASYGRHDNCTCEHTSILTTDCHSDQSLPRVKEICEGNNECQVLASNSIFGDPCVNTFKYLTIKYKCKRNPPVIWQK